VNVLFDNCTSPRLASALDGFIAADGHHALHIKDLAELPNGRNSADIEWIDLLRKNNQNWIFISGDGRILKNSAEKAALRSAGLHGFILSPAYQKTMLHQVAATIIWKWPEIEAVAKLLAPPSMHEIPIGRIQKIRQLSF
jgi:PIN like domain